MKKKASPKNPQIEKYIGVDYGSKRVGVAISDDHARLAFPQAVIKNSPGLIKEVMRLIKESKPIGIVIGESRTFSGNMNPIMKDVIIFADDIKKASKLPIFFEPEFLTSHQATHIQGAHDMLDASAAAIILQSFLDKEMHKKGI